MRMMTIMTMSENPESAFSEKIVVNRYGGYKLQRLGGHFQTKCSEIDCDFESDPTTSAYEATQAARSHRCVAHGDLL